MPAKFPEQVSKQPTPPVVLTRPLSSVRKRRGGLTSTQMRRLGGEGIPGIVKETLIDQAIAGLGWKVVSPTGKKDAQTEYYTLLIEHANDGEGAAPFFSRFADDILTTLQGGHFEIFLSGGGVPVALYNVDSVTIEPNPYFPKQDSEHPWEQKVAEEVVLFRRNEMAHAYWHPVVEIGYQTRNTTPFELCYYYLCILAGTDDWNMDLVADPFPAGVLSLPGATAEEAGAFQASWDYAIQGGSLRDLAVIYGLDLKQAQHIKFTRPPTDMAFEVSNHWYASLVAASFEMSVLDISILTKVSTKAGAESQERLSAQQGQRKLRKIVAEAIERWILPEGYKLKWIVPKPEDEATQAEAAERRARAVNYYVMALGPEVGYEVAQQAGLISEGEGGEQDVGVVKSQAVDLAVRADLLGYMPLQDWEHLMCWVQRAAALPADLWGQELFDWVAEQYGREMYVALENWADEVDTDPILAAEMFQKVYQASLLRSAVRAYVAGKQRDAADEEEASGIALVALTLVELMMIEQLIADNMERFRQFMVRLVDDGIDYAKRAAWRTGLYIDFLRRFFLIGVTEMANPVTDMIKIDHGTSLEPCEECIPRWGTYTVEEYAQMGGPPPNWCLGFDNCTCEVTVLRNVR